MVVGRWSMGVLLGFVMLQGFVGLSSAQKTSGTETLVWDAAKLSSSDSDFNENRLHPLSEGWESFSSSSYQVGNSSSGYVGHYYLHLRKRVSLATVQKELAELRAGNEAALDRKNSSLNKSLADVGYKLVTGDAASKAPNLS